MASQTIVGPGLQFTQDNNYCYALSGQIAVGNSITLLEYTTDSAFIVGDMQFSVGEDTTDNLVFETYFNGVIVSGVLIELSAMGQPTAGVKLIIPPFTLVKVIGQNFSGAPTARKGYATFTGRVYKHLEVRN